MRLPHPGEPLQQHALFDDREALRQARAVLQRLVQLFVVDDVVRQRAVLISLRDARVGDEPLAGAAADAVAPRDARDTVNVDRLPSGVVAELARHGAIVSLAY
jgi:hypothetical protein